MPNDDYVVRPLKTAAGTLEITGPGGTVWVDGEDTRQTLPYKGELCPSPNGEPRVVEIRSARGRHVERVDPKPGVNVPIAATPRPAIAILAQNLLPQGYTENLRETLERRLLENGIEGATFFSVRNDVAQRAMKEANVAAGWLALDRDGRELHDQARVMTEASRLRAGTAISRALDVQGVAEISVPAYQQRAVLLTYLANGSSVPETIEIKLDEPRSVQAAVQYFNGRFRLSDRKSVV